MFEGTDAFCNGRYRRRERNRNSNFEAKLDAEPEELREILVRPCKSRPSPGDISSDADEREISST
jgi:hypothetical protein